MKKYQESFKIQSPFSELLWFFLYKEPKFWNDQSIGEIAFKDGTIDLFHKYLHREDGPAIEYIGNEKASHFYYLGESCGRLVKNNEDFDTWKKLKYLEKFK